MKYAWKNIRSLLREDKFIMLMLFLSVFTTVIMLLFSYCIYQNYQIERESETNEQNYMSLLTTYSLERDYKEEYEAGEYKYVEQSASESHVTKEMLIQFFDAIDPKLYQSIESVNTAFDVAGYLVLSNFGLNSAGPTVDPSEEKYLIRNGDYFTERTFSDGDQVALVSDIHSDIILNSFPIVEEMMVDENHIQLGDTLYEIIGFHNGYPDCAIIPVTALPDNAILADSLSIYFKKSVTAYEYEQIKAAAEQVFQNRMTVCDVLLPDVDKIRLHNTILVIAVLISMIAAFTFGIVFRYVIKVRTRQMIIFRMCGMKYHKGFWILIQEALMLLVIPAIVAVCFFAKCFLPWIARLYAYAFSTIDKTIYLSFLGIYIGMTIVVLSIMLRIQLKKKTVLEVNEIC